MSYDIRLVDKVTRETLCADFEPPVGGVMMLGESRHGNPCKLNVTYNYADHFYKHMDKERGIRSIYGMTAKESIPVLEKAIAKLGDDVDPDYWKGTEGNAKVALKGLLTIARAADPNGVWTGD